MRRAVFFGQGDGLRAIALGLVAVVGAAGIVTLPAVDAPWRYVHRWLGLQRDQMARDLETAHRLLLERARAAGDDALVEELATEPPRPRSRGYGVLPEILDDPPPHPNEIRERTYSLESLSTIHAVDFRDASVLARRMEAEGNLPLRPWVDEFDRLRDRMSNLEDHLDYHAKWQVAVVGHRRWFEQRTRIAERVRAMVDLEDQGASADEIERTRRDIVDELAPFRPTAGLRISTRPDGVRVLPVVVQTDIEDAVFLATFRDAVERAYNRSEAARGFRFTLELEWDRVDPRQLYPGGPPEQGAEIDVDDHLARFPDGALVLTTGAEGTHAWTGRGVLLGPGGLTRRTLAHEFGHLLGFDDAYLRGFEGNPSGPFGAVLVEWVGLQDDLMGNPNGGLVTGEMIESLLDAYGAPSAVGE